MDALSQIARAVLYEGYVLWPYRRSALKNQQRWTFGGIYPAAFANASGGADRAAVRTECLLEAPLGTRVDVSVRFLHVVARQLMQPALHADGAPLVPVAELQVGNVRYLSWDEATEREVCTCVVLGDEAASVERRIAIEAGAVEELLTDSAGAQAGAIVRSWQRIDATVVVHATPLDSYAPRRVFRLSGTVTNDSAWRGDSSERAAALRETLASAHLVLRADDGAFISATDPPELFAGDVGRCRNEGLWPVLVGEAGARDTMFASPIILGDYPRIAPESPGDLFDGGEIDQLLILNILTLSDEEQREMRDSDPRAREILERCASLSHDDLMRLHGTVRALQSVANESEELDERHLV
jgi:hypothetical protein